MSYEGFLDEYAAEAGAGRWSRAGRAGRVDVEWLLWMCETLAVAAAGTAYPVGYPTRQQSAVLSPTGPACVPQDHLEPVLLDHLRGLPAAEVELGVEVVDVTDGADGADGVRVVLRDTATGATRVRHAAYVIAADGAHSTVRRAVSIPMHGPDRLESAATAVFRAPLWDLIGEHRYGIYGVEPAEGPGTFLPAGPGDRWIFGVRFDPEREGPDDFTAERFIRLIRAGAGVADLPVQVERMGTFSFAAQIAERFRVGRVFLVGDAAHRVTPRGGTGMNTAIADGYDLGWKLAWVLRGWASPELLDTYEAERRPVAEHNVARSADPGGSRRRVDEELPADLGGRIRHLWLPASRTSTLDLLGPGLTVFIGFGGARASLGCSGGGGGRGREGGVAAARQAGPRPDVGARDGHPRRRCARGPARRRTGRSERSGHRYRGAGQRGVAHPHQWDAHAVGQEPAFGADLDDAARAAPLGWQQVSQRRHGGLTAG